MYGHPLMFLSYRVTIKPISRRQQNGRRIYQVVACAQGIFFEPKKIWRQPYDLNHWVLNLREPRKVGTFINPAKALFNRGNRNVPA
jgi:hypothetical protein